MPITKLSSYLIVFVIVMLQWPLQAQVDLQELKQHALNLQGEELYQHVVELASDTYQGRLTGTPEYQKAAQWLVNYFDSLGLEPGFRGDWFQWFENPYTLVKPGCTLELKIPIKGQATINKAYRYFDEFIPGSTSADGTLEADVVFVGWGISAPELGYDDYKGIDVRGKIVLLRPEAPVSPRAGAEVFLPWFTYSTHQYKMKNALDHGAAGFLYHYGPLVNTNSDYYPELIHSLVGDQVVEDLFQGSGKNYDELIQTIQEELKPKSFDLKKKVRISNKTEYHPEGKGSSVFAFLRGQDPALSDELIIVGGHLDHVGACYEVCPGAQDNASGIAVLMGLAKLLKDSGVQLKRSILFVGFGAEEQGLIGSLAYCNDPAFDLKETIAYINLDCVGVGPHLHAGGGENYPALYAAIERANNRYVHRQLTTSYSANLGRPRSDAAVFMKAGVPSLSFSSRGGRGFYHNPLDDINTIWPETLEDLSVMLAFAVTELANRVDQPVRGPEKGHLIIAGGALRDSAVFARFVELAGGQEAKIVVVPTAGDDRSLERQGYLERLERSFAKYGIERVNVLHTRDPKVSNDPDFYAPLLEASGVWFNGGRQWRLADSYLNTQTHEAFKGVLERGGVIGGSSAGATIQGTYLFRGDTKTNTILCGDHETGLGFMTNVAIDQHLLARNRQFDLFEALEKYPGVLGIGLDENTAIEVQGARLRVLGQHYVLVYDGKFHSRDRGGYVNQTRGAYPFYLLKPGQEYDLEKLEIIR